jgi:xylitol oxidase
VGEQLTNWAGNVAFAATAVRTPSSVDELRELVRSSKRVKAAGARHSFTEVGQTDGTLVDTRRLDGMELLDGGLVRVGPGASYGAVGAFLAGHGRALANYASLPHVTIGGAVATATHGSGAVQPSLASAVSELELVGPDGELTTLAAGDERFDASVVSLGALGIFASLTLQTVPEEPMRQWVFEGLPWELVEDGAELARILGTGYSTSLFTLWDEPSVLQVWVKSAEASPPDLPATLAKEPLHPVPGADPANCTEQLGVPGPSAERLPHFRLDGVPSAGDELQSEYAVAAGSAPAAVRALRAIAPELRPHLHTSEIRAIAADRFWLSPFYERETVTFHFTWKHEPAVHGAIARVEAALRPLEPRPHWAKLSGYDAAHLRAVHPRLADFAALRRELDPDAKLANAFLDRLRDA